MEIEGKIILDLGQQSGTSRTGNVWKKKEYVLETFGQYPRKVKFTVFGDRSDTLVFIPGQSYAVSVDVESREYQGRWYTDVNAYAARQIEAGVPPMGAEPQPMMGAAAPAAPVDPFAPGANAGEDLPF